MKSIKAGCLVIHYHEIGPEGGNPVICLATNRRRSHPTFAIDDLGFRIARSF